MKFPFEKIFETDLVHPLERKYLRECQKNPLFDWLARESSALQNRIDDRAEALLFRLPVTKFTVPRLWRLYETALSRLDCREQYPLFLKFDYAIKFEVSGSEADSYIITLSDAYDGLTDEEILALLGQALGRIKAGHVHNLRLLKILQQGAGSLPMLGAVAEKALWAAFAEWNIAAQFSIDRAALFACGSEKAVASLLMKQCGESQIDIQEILDRSITRPNELGIYFVWLMQSLPEFGGVERIQRLRQWIRSEQFRENYPGFYFRSLQEDATVDDTACPHFELHQAAADGNPRAQTALAEKYLRGEDVPTSTFVAQHLLKAATFHGDARAMYVLALVLENLSDKNSALVRRLREVSARRGFNAALQKIGTLSAPKEFPFVEKVCAEFGSRYRNQTACKTVLDENFREQIRAAFWMNPDEKIFAAEILFGNERELFGVAITPAGVCGRLSENLLPFRFSWQEINRDGLYKRQLRDYLNYMTVGTEPIYCVEKDLYGTAAELLVRLAKAAREI